MKNILILSNYLPNQGWGGGVIIRSLTENYPKNCKLFWTTFSIKENQLHQTCNGIEVLNFKNRHFRGRGISDMILYVESQIFANNFNAFIRQNNIDLIWIVLGTSYDQLYLLNALSQTISVPYHVSVHDDPILEITASKKQKSTVFFKNILKKATTIDVISARMQTKYLQEFKVNSIVVTRGIPDDFPQNDSLNPNYKTILMGGYGNASQPWPNPLIAALEKLNVSHNFKLHLFDPKLKPFENEHVKVQELISENAFNLLLKTVDLGYACDDLQTENLKFAQLSLPTKIITYIGAGIPFLYHGPKNSTVGDLIKHYEAGIIVDSNNADDIAQAFLKLIADYSYYQQNCTLAKEKLFSQTTIQKHFFDTLLNQIL